MNRSPLSKFSTVKHAIRYLCAFISIFFNDCIFYLYHMYYFITYAIYVYLREPQRVNQRTIIPKELSST